MKLDDLHAEELKRFSYWTRRIAKEQGVGINELHRRSRLGQGTYFSAIHGKGNPTSRTMTAIAQGLDRTLFELLAPVPESETEPG